MKKFLTTILIALAAFTSVPVTSAQAQVVKTSGFLLSSPTHATTDTVDNTETVTQKIAIAGYQNLVVIQPVLTKISGTAGGVVRLYGSIDGTNFVRINSTDSLLVTNVTTQSKVFIVTPSSYTHYQIGYTGTGSMSVKLQTPVIWRKQ